MEFGFPLIANTILRWSVTATVCIGMLWAVLSLMIKRDRAFRCPDCGGPVDESAQSSHEAGSPTLQLCRACDVWWKTGTRPD